MITSGETQVREPDLGKAYGHAYKELTNALHRHNPLRIGRWSKAPTYRPVMGTILPRWDKASTADALQRIIYEEFKAWYEPIYGPRYFRTEGRFERTARRAWVMSQLWGNEQHTLSVNDSEKVYADLFYKVLWILHSRDPIGIAFMADEYTPEASTVVPRLGEAKSVEDLTNIIHEEFVRWFDAQTAGLASKYVGIAQDIWNLRGEVNSSLNLT